MKTLGTILACVAVFAALAGCKSTQPAAIPSNQMTPVVWNADTAAVLTTGLQTGGKVLASCLEQNAESGIVIYVSYDGWVYNPDGTLFLDQAGRPIKLKYEVVAKLNSLKELAEMQGVDSVDYIVGGFGYLKDLEGDQKGKDLRPEALRLHLKGAAVVKAVDSTAANREAAGKEREAIYAGLSKYAEARGVAFATQVKAVADGVVQVTTATGVIVGQVMSAKAVTIAGVAEKAVEAVIRRTTGSTETVVAAGAEAEALCDGCAEAGQ